MKASLDEAHVSREYQGSPNAEAVRRVMLLLSQSNIRQHLECQVRYYLSWKLLSRQTDEVPHIGNWRSVDAREDAQQPTLGCFNGVHTSPKYEHSLAFKATVALVLDWLKAHSLTHAANVLCPEAALRETEVMSQRECLAVLRLPQCLLEDQASSVTSPQEDSSLLGRLVSFAAQGPANVSVCEKGHMSLNGLLNVHPRSSCAGLKAEGSPRSLASPACRGLVPARATSSKNPSLFQRPAKRFRRAFAMTKNCGVYRQPCRRYMLTAKAGGECKMLGFDEEAKTQLLLLAAKIRRLELHNSSGQFFSALDEVTQCVNQRLAAIDSKHSARIKGLQKTMKHGIVKRAYKPAPKSGLQKNEGRPLQRWHIQKVADATSAHSAKDEKFGAAAVEGREKPSMKTPPELSTLNRRAQHGVNKKLAKENADLRLQLVALREHAKALQKQLQKYNISHDQKPQPRINDSQALQETILVQKTCCKPSESSFALSDTGLQAAPWAMKQEYEGRVAHLLRKLQEKANQIQAKDADFRFLVGELEFARQKSAQVGRKARRLQKLYEAAKAAQAQQRSLAASVSLSLKTLALAEEPSLGPDGGEVFATGTILKASRESDGADHAPDLQNSILKTSPDQALVTEPYVIEGPRNTQKDYSNEHTMLLDVDVAQSTQGHAKQAKQHSQHERGLQSNLESLTPCSTQLVQLASAKITSDKAELLTNTRQFGKETALLEPACVKRHLSMPRETTPERNSLEMIHSDPGRAVGSSEVLYVDGSPINFLSASAHLLTRAGASLVGRVMPISEPTVHWSHLKQTLKRSQPSSGDSPGETSKNSQIRGAKVLDSVNAAHLPSCFNTVRCRVHVHGEAISDAAAEADSAVQLKSSPREENLPPVGQSRPAVPRVTGQASQDLTAHEKAKQDESQQTVNSTTKSDVSPRNGLWTSAKCSHEVDAGTHVQPVCHIFAGPCAIAQPTEGRVRCLANPDASSTQKSSFHRGGASACSYGVADSSPSFSADIGAVLGNESEHGTSHRIEGSGAQASRSSLADSRARERSVISSQPETPGGLSNFPSLSCPVATPSTLHEADEYLLRLGREHVVEGRSPLSISPSESDWLACVSSSPKADAQVE